MKHKTVAGALRRLSAYAGYIGCGCNSPGFGGACSREPQCAKTDFKRSMRQLRQLLRTEQRHKGKGAK